MRSPRIIVGMSCYNEAEYLSETIPAVLAQTMPYFQLLIIDNGSTDGSWEILKSFQDSRITLIHSPENLKPGVVANFVWSTALDLWRSCRWILGAGADDIMAPDYLEAVLAAADAHPDANVIFSPWSFIGGKPEDKRFPEFNADTCHAVHQVPAWNACTRELWGALGGHDETLIASDWDWVVRAAVYGVLRPHQLDRPYIRLRVRTGARKTQSDEVHWPTLHRHLCTLASKPVPSWARA